MRSAKKDFVTRKQDPIVIDPNLMHRIAECLGVPVEAFFLRDTADTKSQAFDDTAELIQLFLRIGDRQVRRRCIAYVRASVGDEDLTLASSAPPE